MGTLKVLSQIDCGQDIAVLETLNQEFGQIKHAALYIKGGVVEWVGATRDLPHVLQSAETVMSLADHAVIPGLVNTHHHMFQCLTRCIAQVTSPQPISQLYAMLVTCGAASSVC